MSALDVVIDLLRLIFGTYDEAAGRSVRPSVLHLHPVRGVVDGGPLVRYMGPDVPDDTATYATIRAESDLPPYLHMFALPDDPGFSSVSAPIRNPYTWHDAGWSVDERALDPDDPRARAVLPAQTVVLSWSVATASALPGTSFAPLVTLWAVDHATGDARRIAQSVLGDPQPVAAGVVATTFEVPIGVPRTVFEPGETLTVQIGGELHVDPDPTTGAARQEALRASVGAAVSQPQTLTLGEPFLLVTDLDDATTDAVGSGSCELVKRSSGEVLVATSSLTMWPWTGAVPDWPDDVRVLETATPPTLVARNAGLLAGEGVQLFTATTARNQPAAEVAAADRDARVWQGMGWALHPVHVDAGRAVVLPAQTLRVNVSMRGFSTEDSTTADLHASVWRWHPATGDRALLATGERPTALLGQSSSSETVPVPVDVPTVALRDGETLLVQLGAAVDLLDHDTPVVTHYGNYTTTGVDTPYEYTHVDLTLPFVLAVEGGIHPADAVGEVSCELVRGRPAVPPDAAVLWLADRPSTVGGGLRTLTPVQPVQPGLGEPQPYDETVVPGGDTAPRTIFGYGLGTPWVWRGGPAGWVLDPASIDRGPDGWALLPRQLVAAVVAAGIGYLPGEDVSGYPRTSLLTRAEVYVFVVDVDDPAHPATRAPSEVSVTKVTGAGLPPYYGDDQPRADRRTAQATVDETLIGPAQTLAVQIGTWGPSTDGGVLPPFDQHRLWLFAEQSAVMMVMPRPATIVPDVAADAVGSGSCEVVKQDAPITRVGTLWPWTQGRGDWPSDVRVLETVAPPTQLSPPRPSVMVSYLDGPVQPVTFAARSQTRDEVAAADRDPRDWHPMGWALTPDVVDPGPSARLVLPAQTIAVIAHVYAFSQAAPDTWTPYVTLWRWNPTTGTHTSVAAGGGSPRVMSKVRQSAAVVVEVVVGEDVVLAAGETLLVQVGGLVDTPIDTTPENVTNHNKTVYLSLGQWSIGADVDGALPQTRVVVPVPFEVRPVLDDATADAVGSGSVTLVRGAGADTLHGRALTVLWFRPDDLEGTPPPFRLLSPVPAPTIVFADVRASSDDGPRERTFQLPNVSLAGAPDRDARVWQGAGWAVPAYMVDPDDPRDLTVIPAQPVEVVVDTIGAGLKRPPTAVLRASLWAWDAATGDRRLLGAASEPVPTPVPPVGFPFRTVVVDVPRTVLTAGETLLAQIGVEVEAYPDPETGAPQVSRVRAGIGSSSGLPVNVSWVVVPVPLTTIRTLDPADADAVGTALTILTRAAPPTVMPDCHADAVGVGTVRLDGRTYMPDAAATAVGVGRVLLRGYMPDAAAVAVGSVTVDLVRLDRTMTTMTGTTYDDRGQPVPHAQVHVRVWEPDHGMRRGGGSLVGMAATEADAEGRWSVELPMTVDDPDGTTYRVVETDPRELPGWERHTARHIVWVGSGLTTVTLDDARAARAART